MDDAKQLLLWWQSLVAGIGPAIHLWPEARCQLVPTEIPRRCMSLGVVCSLSTDRLSSYFQPAARVSVDLLILMSFIRHIMWVYTRASLIGTRR